MATAKIAHRVDTAANWTSANPTLALGEMGFESDTGASKIGDGSTAYGSLGYNVPPSDTAWTMTTSLDNGWTGRVRYIKRAGWVTVIVDGVDGSASVGQTFLNLPSGYRPSVTARAALTNSAAPGRGAIITDGGASIADITSATIRGSFTYPVL